jgi:glutathione S-transferase
MSELILHHYDTSPFSEKMRLIFGYKKIAWRSVSIPSLMPKPDVIALTGAYRKTPIVQVGKDIYCDTALIAKRVESRVPLPTLYPPGQSGAAELLAQWADTALFWTVIAYTLQPAGFAVLFAGSTAEQQKAFAADRAPFTAGMVRAKPADAEAALQTYLARLEDQLADGRAFLCGEAASIADFSVAQCCWFVHRAPALATIFAAYPRVSAHYARVKAFGHGEPAPMTSAEALVVAASAIGFAPTEVIAGLGFDLGDEVSVMPTDTGRDPSAGSLVGLTRDEVVIRRSDERAGTVHVHFPRIAMQITRLEPS